MEDVEKRRGMNFLMTTIRHERAVFLWNECKRTEGVLLGVLMQMEALQELDVLQCTGLFDYCSRFLKMTEEQASYFSRVARKAKEVPELKAAIDEGTLTVSKARRIVPVLTQANSAEWIEKASTLKQKDLEREVSRVNPQATVREKLKPVAIDRTALQVGISTATEKAIQRARDILSQKLGRAVSLEEVISAMAETYLDRHDPVRKAARASSSRLAYALVTCPIGYA